MLKIRRSRDCLIFKMEIPIPEKTFFILRQDPDGVSLDAFMIQWRWGIVYWNLHFPVHLKWLAL